MSTILSTTTVAPSTIVEKTELPIFSISELAGKKLRVYWNARRASQGLAPWSVKIADAKGRFTSVDGYARSVDLVGVTIVRTKREKEGLSNSTAGRKAFHADLIGMGAILDDEGGRVLDLYKFENPTSQFEKTAQSVLLRTVNKGTSDAIVLQPEILIPTIVTEEEREEFLSDESDESDLED